ncbi:DUF4192 domain-containing protein [Gordonia sp. ABSL1-1]|uniref:DUF4192 domain-containing protein n=1 Tax=Gordonia sp. ABSL1-1 TaxID=3053923 RepID=UPI00257335D1|nr:DUF4192 domain-containing protein [Gordonia sp. ABSL1-1]MDL9936375.1 DUF4192 domain-containing protein [Gordonia sp. ABSL1-1]
MSRRTPFSADPGALLTAVPALLGFVPERSIIVLVCGAEHTVEATMRHDLALTPDGRPTTELIGVLDHLGAICADYVPAQIVVVIADDRYPPDDARYRRVMAVADRLLAAQAGVCRGFVVGEFASGAPWSAIWPVIAEGRDARSEMTVGILEDPWSCPTAVAVAVVHGRPLLRRREEIAEMLAPEPGCADPGCRHHASVDGTDGSVVDSAELFATVVDSVRRPRRRLDCATLAELDRAITELRVRDAAMALAVNDDRDNAEKLWRQLTRRLTGSGRASAATLLAHLHYIRGEGAYAGVALDIALSADPTWSMAHLLDDALRTGLRPAILWTTVSNCYRIAEELGQTLPRPTLRRASWASGDGG